MELISGFSKLSKSEKIAWLCSQCDNQDLAQVFSKFIHQDNRLQKNLDGFSENTLSNFYFPYGVTPNFLLNGKTYAVPMVTEESSVVAASSKAAKFWHTRGGFHAEMVKTNKVGHIHFYWQGPSEKLLNFFQEKREELIQSVEPILEKMKSRGGGLRNVWLKNFTDQEENYYQI